MSFTAFCLMCLGAVLVVEGLLYACFTENMRRMMMLALSQPPEILRNAGIASALVGLTILSLVITLFQI